MILILVVLYVLHSLVKWLNYSMEQSPWEAYIYLATLIVWCSPWLGNWQTSWNRIFEKLILA